MALTTQGFSQNTNTVKYRSKYINYFKSQPDSAYYYLKQLLKNNITEPDSIKAKDFNNASIYFLYNNQKDSAVYYIKKSLGIGSLKNNINTSINLGSVYKKYGEYQKAMQVYDTILQNKHLTIKDKGITHSELASIYSLNDNFEKAKYHFTESIDLLNKSNAKHALAICEINFGNFYKKNQLQELALPLYKKSATYFLENKNNRNHYLALINHSGSLYDLNRFIEAENTIKKVNHNNLIVLNDKWLLAGYYNLRGNILSHKKDKNLNDSINYFYKSSVTHAKAVQNNETLLYYNDYLNYLLEQKDTLTLKRELQTFKIDSIYNQADLRQKTAFLTTLLNSNINAILKKDASLEQLIILRDSLNNNTKKVIKNELFIKNTTLDLNKKNIEKLKKSNVYTLISISLIVFTILILLIILFRKKIKKTQAIVNTQKDTLDTVKTNSAKTSASLTKKIIDLDLTNLRLREELNKFSKRHDSKEEKNMYWKSFIVKFNDANTDFISYITKNYPQLTKSDIALCTLLKLNFSNNEISEILNIQYHSVIVKKRRLKEKLGLENSSKLEHFISNLV